jgi:hypothetical protein
MCGESDVKAVSAVSLTHSFGNFLKKRHRISRSTEHKSKGATTEYGNLDPWKPHGTVATHRSQGLLKQETGVS